MLNRMLWERPSTSTKQSKERLLHGEKPLQEIDHRTYDERGVNGLGPKLIAQQDEGQNEQHDVDQQQVGTYRNDRKQLIDHQGQS